VQSRIASRYTILSTIGEGGMGVVHEAEDSRLHRRVAIKLLRPDALGDPERQRRFRFEARAASALNHPNIVTIHDIDSGEEGDFIVMELVAGTPLNRLIPQGGMPIDKAVAVARQIAGALAAAHASGIVHRDLKPANVIVSSEGQVKVVDFGLAKRVSAPGDATRAGTMTNPATGAGTIVGTDAYMSPEQALGQPTAARSDVFSFGITLYQMLTGRLPFDTDSRFGTLEALVRRDATPPRSVRSAIPADLDRFVMKALQKDPAKRFGAGDELLSAIQAIENTSATPPRRSRAWLSAAAVAALGLGVAGGVWFTTRAARDRAAVDAALQDIDRLTTTGKYYAAVRVARRIARAYPSNPRAVKSVDLLTVPVSATTTPPGGDVYIREYAGSPEWEHLGKAPLTDVRVPTAMLRWKAEKPGYVTAESGFWTAIGRADFILHETGEQPEGMVFVPGGSAPAFGDGEPIRLPGFWIDKYEVSNREYQRFVDAGGYQNRTYWKEPFLEDGRTLEWTDAIQGFRDQTGRPGPATWELGRFPEGQADIPVHGISWYEAAAYAAFTNKTVPTLHHWRRAIGQIDFENVSSVSNFAGKGPLRAGATEDLGPYGTFQMAGNVREWAWNAIEDRHFIVGGAWNEPAYMATKNDAARAFDRSETNGVRCMRGIDGIPADALTRLERPRSNVPDLKPANDELFAAYRRLYAYDATPLDARMEASVDDEDWRRERVSVRTAYSDERLPIVLYLPKHARPPYEVVIWYGGGDIYRIPTVETPGTPFYWDFLVRSGRAVIIPVFKGTYERRSATLPRGSFGERDQRIQQSKDFGRTIDYLFTRSDIDRQRLAYYGFSTGASMGPVLLALEPRIVAAALISAGLGTAAPEFNTVNFAPRVTIPVLMLSGRDDFGAPIETSQKPLFERLGTAPDKKKHVVFDNAGHAPPRLGLIREVLDWFDKYLGPLSSSS
jgi:formylglycine-generating enzyme required for sulfatase activity/dienelactone hydrolase